MTVISALLIHLLISSMVGILVIRALVMSR